MIHLNWHSPWEDTKSIKIKNRIINAFCGYTTAMLLAHKPVSYIKNLFHLITKLNKHLPSWKVNLNSSFDGVSWVWVETLRQLKPTWELLWDYFWASFFFWASYLHATGWVGGHLNSRTSIKRRIQMNLQTQ